MKNIDKNLQLRQYPFSFQFTKEKKLLIYRRHKLIKIIKGKTSEGFYQFSKNADNQAIQLRLAKLTGHYK